MGSALLAAAIPPALCVGAMLFTNWARFGSFTEFGMRYQLTGPVQPEVLFSVGDLVRNLGVYAWNFPRVSRYFPFFTTPATGPFGVFTAFPAVSSPWARSCLRSRTRSSTHGIRRTGD